MASPPGAVAVKITSMAGVLPPQCLMLRAPNFPKLIFPVLYVFAFTSDLATLI